MKILFLTQYFPPETGAPQNRIHSLAHYLNEAGAQITILTAMPNYPKGEVHDAYKGKWFMKETDGDLKLVRAWIYATKSKNIFPRLINYFSFVISAAFAGIFLIRKNDIVICESPPLFLGITAILIKFIKGSKLVFNVSDLWPESAEKLGLVNNKQLLRLSYALEAYLYKKSNLVSGQTQGIINSINSRFPKTKTHLLRNGIDIKQFDKGGNRSAFRQKHQIPDSGFVITYAGIIGHAQGLKVILEAALLLQNQKDIHFLIVGDGPVKPTLIKKAEQMNVLNIKFIDSVPRSEMPDVIAACDAYVAPLKKNDLFLGAIPSKIFEPLYFGKPVLLGINGEAKTLFVDEGECALHYEPENADLLAAQIINLKQNDLLYKKLSNNGKSYVTKNFNRQELAMIFWEKLNRL